VATQTLTFLFADIEGPAAMVQRLGDAYAGRAGEVFQLHAGGWPAALRRRGRWST